MQKIGVLDTQVYAVLLCKGLNITFLSTWYYAEACIKFVDPVCATKKSEMMHPIIFGVLP